jgi:RNA polymerase sigma-70 factor (ECF subfamily)
MRAIFCDAPMEFFFWTCFPRLWKMAALMSRFPRQLNPRPGWSAPRLRSAHHDRLLDAAQGGDAAAFWQLAEGYRPYLRTVATRVLGGQLPSDASDVISHSLSVAFERLAQFQDRHAAVFLGWLAAIVRNEALKALRHVGRKQPLPADSGGGEQLAADQSGPETRAARREQAARLLAAIHRLPEDYRTVIELRNLKELPFAEVAQRMARSPEAVRKLWTRAMDRLREELGEIT